jgi:DNA adenine methylase
LINNNNVKIIRYPGGKQKILNSIIKYLPTIETIQGKYVEPFAGSASVFFRLNPAHALLNDINPELISFYKVIRNYPNKVWHYYNNFDITKEAYYEIRNTKPNNKNLAFCSARFLFLNRTSFKGMFRYNLKGDFNVGYGGQDRRWIINQEILVNVSKMLKKTILTCKDFEKIIDICSEGDFIFVDPPYKPGYREVMHSHYWFGKFTFDDHIRLAKALKLATERGVNWALTTSYHQDILKLFKHNTIKKLDKGTGIKPGAITNQSKEVIIFNY